MVTQLVSFSAFSSLFAATFVFPCPAVPCIADVLTRALQPIPTDPTPREADGNVHLTQFAASRLPSTAGITESRSIAQIPNRWRIGTDVVVIIAVSTLLLPVGLPTYKCRITVANKVCFRTRCRRSWTSGWLLRWAHA